jgi:hypothetical protein
VLLRLRELVVVFGCVVDFFTQAELHKVVLLSRAFSDGQSWAIKPHRFVLVDSTHPMRGWSADLGMPDPGYLENMLRSHKAWQVAREALGQHRAVAFEVRLARASAWIPLEPEPTDAKELFDAPTLKLVQECKRLATLDLSSCHRMVLPSSGSFFVASLRHLYLSSELDSFRYIAAVLNPHASQLVSLRSPQPILGSQNYPSCPKVTQLLWEKQHYHGLDFPNRCFPALQYLHLTGITFAQLPDVRAVVELLPSLIFLGLTFATACPCTAKFQLPVRNRTVVSGPRFDADVVRKRRAYTHLCKQVTAARDAPVLLDDVVTHGLSSGAIPAQILLNPGWAPATLSLEEPVPTVTHGLSSGAIPAQILLNPGWAPATLSLEEPVATAGLIRRPARSTHVFASLLASDGALTLGHGADVPGHALDGFSDQAGQDIAADVTWQVPVPVPVPWLLPSGGRRF